MTTLAPRLLLAALVGAGLPFAAGCARPAAGPSPEGATSNAARAPDGSGAAPDPRAQGPDAERAAPETFEGTAGIVDAARPGARTAVLRAVRTARHDGFDRIVFEFEGAVPGYHVEYVDRPVRRCGSGDVVALAGDGWLEIRFTPAAAHTEAGEATVTQRELTPGLPVLRELKATCDFEADVTWVAGLASPNRYRVLELAGPPRFVVDVEH